MYSIFNNSVIVCYSFIIAVDYFQARYPGTTVIFDMSVVYIVMAFFAVFANNILVETLSLNTRITFGKTHAWRKISKIQAQNTFDNFMSMII